MSNPKGRPRRLPSRKRVNIILTDDLHTWLDTYSRSQNLSRSLIIRKALIHLQATTSTK